MAEEAEDVEVGQVWVPEERAAKSEASLPVLKPYPCLCVLDAGQAVGARGRTCWEPSSYYARGNEARYGHVCGDCWQGFTEAERDLYAHVGLPVVELVGVTDAETGERLEVLPGDPPTVVDARAAHRPFVATLIGTKS